MKKQNTNVISVINQFKVQITEKTTLKNAY